MTASRRAPHRPESLAESATTVADMHAAIARAATGAAMAGSVMGVPRGTPVTAITPGSAVRTTRRRRRLLDITSAALSARRDAIGEASRENGVRSAAGAVLDPPVESSASLAADMGADPGGRLDYGIRVGQSGGLPSESDGLRPFLDQLHRLSAREIAGQVSAQAKAGLVAAQVGVPLAGGGIRWVVVHLVPRRAGYGTAWSVACNGCACLVQYLYVIEHHPWIVCGDCAGTRPTDRYASRAWWRTVGKHIDRAARLRDRAGRKWIQAETRAGLLARMREAVDNAVRGLLDLGAPAAAVAPLEEMIGSAVDQARG